MVDPNSDAIVMVKRVDDTPAAAPDSDADAQITVRTNTHSLPKLTMSFSVDVPSFHQIEYVSNVKIRKKRCWQSRE
jgi:hypothetical protein